MRVGSLYNGGNWSILGGMEPGRYFARWSFAIILGLGMVRANADETPSTAQILQNALARAHSSISRPDYSYTKHTVYDELDAHERVKDHEDEVYRVEVKDNYPHFKLLQMNGRDLSDAEAENKERKEIAEDKKRGSSPAKDEGAPENLLTTQALEKYQATLVNEDMLNGRKAYCLEFQPKGGGKEHDLFDRFLNHIAGRVWIDAQEWEIARVEIHLTSEIKLWEGILGALAECQFTLEQTRLANGAWVTHSSEGMFVGRKFLKSFRVKFHSDSRDFQISDAPR